jgi:hypothetical protein
MNPQTGNPPGVDTNLAASTIPDDDTAPRPAVSLLFELGELTATVEAVTAAHDARVQVIDRLLRHLGGDWGDVNTNQRAANDASVTAGGPLRSLYPLPGNGAALVVTTDAERRHTTVALAALISPPCGPGR